MSQAANTDTTSSAGPADALVLVHGSAGSAGVWDIVRARLGDVRVPVMALDLPGHGARLHEPLLEPTIAAHASWVRQQVRDVGVERVVLAGHSLGSAITLRLALDAPDLVAHAVLIGAGARLRVLPALLERARTDPEASVTEMVELSYAPAHRDQAHAGLAALAPAAPGAIANDLCACDVFDVMSELAAVRVPVNILVGTEDRLTPPKYAQYLHDHIAGSQLYVIQGCGHALMDEAPDEVARALRAALD
jgi:pimeloyl-ACP methyl ester carboxylesterase